MSNNSGYWSLTVVPFLIRQKVYLDRARNYYGYAAFPSMVLLILRSFNVPLTPKFIAIGIPAFILGSLLLGWLDKVLGLFSEEAKRHSSLNPIYDKISAEIVDVGRVVHALHLETRLELKKIKDQGLSSAADVHRMEDKIKHIEAEVTHTKTILSNALRIPGK